MCHDATDQTIDQVDAVPDFSEFRDPWEYYTESTQENPVAHSSQQIPQSHQQISPTNNHQVQKVDNSIASEKSEDILSQISQSMQNLSVQSSQSYQNDSGNISSHTSHDYPHQNNNASQASVQNIQQDFATNIPSIRQHEPSTSRQVDDFEYTRYPPRGPTQIFQGIDETDKLSHQLNTLLENYQLENSNDRVVSNENNEKTFSQSQSQFYTDSNNCVAPQSDPNITSDIEHNVSTNDLNLLKI